MNTQERNQFIDDCDQAMLEALRGFLTSDEDSEESELLELVYTKAHNAIDTLKLPEGGKS